MSLLVRGATQVRARFPRSRGDEPAWEYCRVCLTVFSPLTRG